jgi:ABC-type amino acid transport substrate-binding protein
VRAKTILVVIGFLQLVINSAPAPAETLRVCARSGPFFKSQEGQLYGVEYEILKGFADSRNAELQVEWPKDFASVFTMLEDGTCDIAAARITRTQEREARVSFSISYFPVRVVLVERADGGTSSKEQLVGKTLVTKKGTVYERILSEIPEAELLLVSKDSEMFEAVLSGKADALAYDSAVVLTYLERYPGLRIAIALSERDDYAFALAPDSPLGTPLDEHIRAIKQDGSYERLLVGYYGEELAALVLDPR